MQTETICFQLPLLQPYLNIFNVKLGMGGGGVGGKKRAK